jgi:hypothetical protein
MVRPHQPGESTFRSILPEDIEWKPFPAFPPEARLAWSIWTRKTIRGTREAEHFLRWRFFHALLDREPLARS